MDGSGAMTSAQYIPSPGYAGGGLGRGKLLHLQTRSSRKVLRERSDVVVAQFRRLRLHDCVRSRAAAIFAQHLRKIARLLPCNARHIG